MHARKRREEDGCYNLHSSKISKSQWLDSIIWLSLSALSSFFFLPSMQAQLLSLLLICVLPPFIAGDTFFNQSATECYVSQGGCMWDSPAIWDNQQVPSFNDTVSIISTSSSPILILLMDKTLTLQRVTLNGQITLSVQGSSSFIVQAHLQVGVQSVMNVADSSLVNSAQVIISSLLFTVDFLVK